MIKLVNNAYANYFFKSSLVNTPSPVLSAFLNACSTTFNLAPAKGFFKIKHLIRSCLQYKYRVFKDQLGGGLNMAFYMHHLNLTAEVST